MTKFYKKGYPRPQFVRESFFSLNGEWNFRFDPRKEGIKCGWQNGFEDRKLSFRFRMKVRRAELGYRMNAMLSGIPEASHLNFTKGKESF